ncbi:hypothetical protein FACS189472_11060 [Alphaproteobacteria bacterium]|nr:hypothetical protein FACS189472_11060 [Alphaproteobacteria bacterium]
MHTPKLYVGFHWSQSFKWQEEDGELNYSLKARSLMYLMKEYNYDVDGLDEVGGTSLYLSCTKEEIPGLIDLLKEYDFGDWVYLSYKEGDNFVQLENDQTE